MKKCSTSPARRAAAALLTALLLMPLAPTHAADSLTVDFANKPPHAQKSMAGFLHGMNNTTPRSEFVDQIKPGLWRAGRLTKEIYGRATKAGARYTIVLSDYWGYAKNRQPLQHRDEYLAMIRTITEQTKSVPIIYDIWNEPNVPEFAPGSTAQDYLETFRLAHDLIRSIRPDAVIAGPSTSGLHPKLLEGFLDYCLDKKLRVQVLTWHEYRYGAELAKIAPDIREVRQRTIDNPKYAAIGLQEIQINESMDKVIYLQPGSVLATLLSFEKGKADAAGRSAWDEDFKNNLGGLLTTDKFQPRAIWWLYRSYAQTLDDRVETQVTDNGWATAACVGKGPEGPQATLLVGAYALHGETGPRELNLSLTNIAQALQIPPDAKVEITARVIPPTGAAPLEKPREVPTRTVQLENGAISHSIKIPVESVAAVRIRPVELNR